MNQNPRIDKDTTPFVSRASTQEFYLMMTTAEKVRIMEFIFGAMLPCDDTPDNTLAKVRFYSNSLPAGNQLWTEKYVTMQVLVESEANVAHDLFYHYLEANYRLGLETIPRAFRVAKILEKYFHDMWVLGKVGSNSIMLGNLQIMMNSLDPDSLAGVGHIMKRQVNEVLTEVIDRLSDNDQRILNDHQPFRMYFNYFLATAFINYPELCRHSEHLNTQYNIAKTCLDLSLVGIFGQQSADNSISNFSIQSQLHHQTLFMLLTLDKNKNSWLYYCSPEDSRAHIPSQKFDNSAMLTFNMFDFMPCKGLLLDAIFNQLRISNMANPPKIPPVVRLIKSYANEYAIIVVEADAMINLQVAQALSRFWMQQANHPFNDLSAKLYMFRYETGKMPQCARHSNYEMFLRQLTTNIDTADKRVQILSQVDVNMEEERKGQEEHKREEEELKQEPADLLEKHQFRDMDYHLQRLQRVMVRDAQDPKIFTLAQCDPFGLFGSRSVYGNQVSPNTYEEAIRKRMMLNPRKKVGSYWYVAVNKLPTMQDAIQGSRQNQLEGNDNPNGNGNNGQPPANSNDNSNNNGKAQAKQNQEQKQQPPLQQENDHEQTHSQETDAESNEKANQAVEGKVGMQEEQKVNQPIQSKLGDDSSQEPNSDVSMEDASTVMMESVNSRSKNEKQIEKKGSDKESKE